jgi:hypothetical protein
MCEPVGPRIEDLRKARFNPLSNIPGCGAEAR